MELCVLASGSKGNSAVVSAGSTTILIDAGLSCKQLLTRLESTGRTPEEISAVLFTHDHTDHCSAAPVLAKRLHADFYANTGTCEAIDAIYPGAEIAWSVFDTGEPFEIGDILVRPFPVSHDAAEPVGFVLEHQNSRLFYATDLGVVTDEVHNAIQGCNAAVLESNYDPDMLRCSARPWSLKSRISGQSGHLANDDAADFLAHCAPTSLRAVFLAHISRECNTPSIARSVMTSALTCANRADILVETLSQESPGETFSL